VLGCSCGGIDSLLESGCPLALKLALRVHDNKMERMNGEMRDREKVTGNLKKTDTAMLTGMEIYHNYVRSHMALD